LGDIANPSKSDPYFPVFRHKDWYDGHSWASGLFQWNGGGNQESSSESINGYPFVGDTNESFTLNILIYYGLYLLGLALGNNNMRGMSIMFRVA
jgi:endoglucanase Acf2